MAATRELPSLQCMEVWGGNRATDHGVTMPAIDVYVFSAPHTSPDEALQGGDRAGGDVHFVSSCGTGRIARLVVADVSGHGPGVARVAMSLRVLMRRYMNYLDQTSFVAALNRAFALDEAGGVEGRFATSIAMTFFAPTGRLDVCNAGHPRPLLWRASARRWEVLAAPEGDASKADLDDRDAPPANLPLGILEPTRYEEFSVTLDRDDLVIAYTDAVTEARSPEGRMLGESGLLRLIETLSPTAPSVVLTELRERMDQYRAYAPPDDDLTLLLIHCTRRRTQQSFLARAVAGARFVGIFLRSLVPFGERLPVPWPELRYENIVGAMIPSESRRWRVRGTLGSGHRSDSNMGSDGAAR